MTLPYPEISPTLFSLGPLAFRWYGLMYIAGLIGGYFVIRDPAKAELGLTREDLINFFTYLMIGVILGGRLGYILIYDLAYYLAHPLHLFAYWEGGMSYHGGALGAVIATTFYATRRKVSRLWMLDYIALCSPIGIGLGRLGNFINGELFGRVTTSTPWAMVFPNGGPLPRHPSQLYEALGEGLLLFLLLVLAQNQRLKPLKTGQLFGLYFIFYGIIRFCLEYFREPDAQLGLLGMGLSMGQWLCVGMGSFGIVFLAVHARWTTKSAKS